MEPRKLIDFLGIIEKLKCTTRHCYNTNGVKETVAEHSWRIAVMAMLCADEYPDLDINKVIKMCLIHDFGEALTGDIPAFFKTEDHEAKEEIAIDKILATLPEGYEQELNALFDEMEEMQTPEAKLFKALDHLEAVIAHNESDISTWIDLEYETNLTYGNESSAFSDWTKKLRDEILKDTLKKIKEVR